MTPVELVLVLLPPLVLVAYAAGRMQAKVSYRHGYRFGYRLGYFDADRAAWNRTRPENGATVAVRQPAAAGGLPGRPAMCVDRPGRGEDEPARARIVRAGRRGRPG